MQVRFETFDIGVKHIRIWQQWRHPTPPHYHECIELIHIIEGETPIEIGNTYVLKMGDTIFIPSYAIHSIPDIKYCTYAVLQISLALIPECQRILDRKNPGVMILRGDETGDLGRMFLTAERIYQKKGIYGKLYDSAEEHYNQCRMCAEQVVGTVLRECRRLGRRCCRARDLRTSRSASRTRAFLKAW